MRYFSRSLALTAGFALSATAFGAAVDDLVIEAPLDGNIELVGPRTTIIVDVPGGNDGAGTITDGQQVSKGALIGLDENGAVIAGVFLDVSAGITPQAYDDGGAGVDDLEINLVNVTGVSSFLQTSGVDSFRLIVTTADITLNVNDINGVQTEWSADEAVDQNFDLDRVQPSLVQVIVNEAGTQAFFVFSEGLNTGDATNDPNHTVLADIDGNDFQVGNGSTFPDVATLLTNPTFVGAGNSIIQFDRAASSNVIAGSSFVRPTYTDATPPAVDNDVRDYVKNQATADAAPVTAQADLAVTTSEFLSAVPIGGGNQAGALRVTFNNPVVDPGTADAYVLRRLNAAGTATEDSTLTLSNPTIDPNDPFSVLLDVAPSGTEGVRADARSVSGDVSVPNLAVYTTRVDAATGTTDPEDVFGGVFEGQTDLENDDATEPTLLFVAYGDTNPEDGHQDTVYFVFDEPIGNITSTTGFTIVRNGGVTVRPFQLITSDGELVEATTAANATPANNELGGLTVTRASIDGGGVETGRGVNNAVCVSYDALSFDWDDDGDAGLEADEDEAIPGTGDDGVVQAEYEVATGTIADAAGNEFTNADTDVAMNATVDRARPRLAVAKIFDGDNQDQLGSNRQIFIEDDEELGQDPSNRRLALFFGEELGALNDGNVNDEQVTFGNGNFGPGDFLFVSDNGVTFVANDADNPDALVPGVNVNVLQGSGIEDADDQEALSSVDATDCRAPYLALVSPVDPGSDPIFAAFLADTDADGFADEIRINMNQPILASSVSEESFSVTPGTVTDVAVDTSNPRVIVISLTDGVVSIENEISVTYNGAALATQVTSDVDEGGTGVAVANVNVTFIAQQVPVSQQPTQSPAIMVVVGNINNGGVALPAGTKIYAMIAAPVVKRVTATHNNGSFVVDDQISSSSLEAWTNWLWGFDFASRVYLGRDLENFQFYSNYKDLGDYEYGDIEFDGGGAGAGSGAGGISTYKDVIALSINARSLTQITFTGRGETNADNVTNGSVQLGWDVLRSDDGSLLDLYQDGYESGGIPITSRAVVTGDDGRFELHVSGPISAFNGQNFLNSVDRPIILVVERTDGKRFVVSSLLTSVNGGPLLFRPMNRSQNSNRTSLDATQFNIDVANVDTVSVFPGWNLVGFDRMSGFSTSTSTRPVLPAGMTTANVVTGTTLPFVSPLEQFVFWRENTEDNMWLSTENPNFSDIIIDTKCFRNFAFTMTSFGVQIGSGINNLVGGYGFGFFVNDNDTFGIFQFGAPLTGGSIIASGSTFPNSSTTQGWGLFTAKQDYDPATSITTGNPGLDYIIIFRNNGDNPPSGRTEFEVSSLDLASPGGTDNANNTTMIDAGQAFFGHFQ